MATLRDIQRRIRSVQSTQKITKAMKLVAASKFRRAQERILAARPYATKMRELLGGLAGHSEDETHPLLPIEAQGDGDDGGSHEEYLYEPGPEAILASLLPRHVTIQVYRALMESAAGEFGARMTAMEAASKNAREMINLLTIQYNKARQERITKELLDIVGGAEAL